MAAGLVVSLTDEQLGKILEDAKDQVIEASIQAVRDRISWSAKETISTQIKPVVEKFVQEEIVPELAELLVGQKSVILANIAAQANEIGEAFVKALFAKIAHNLGDDYKRRHVFEALLK